MTEPDHQQRLQQTRNEWDQAAANFDDAPDHGLHHPLVRQAWTDLLRETLSFEHGTVLDIGCGTGSLSMVLASLGHTVTGIDLSPAMIALAQAKAAQLGHPIQFQVMDAAFPNFPPAQFDAILCRHLFWALPEPRQVLDRWTRLLKPAGWLVFIEGYWHTGAGLHAHELEATLPAGLVKRSFQNLSTQSALWGGAVSDERYLMIAEVGAGKRRQRPTSSPSLKPPILRFWRGGPRG